MRLWLCLRFRQMMQWVVIEIERWCAAGRRKMLITGPELSFSSNVSDASLGLALCKRNKNLNMVLLGYFYGADTHLDASQCRNLAL